MLHSPFASLAAPSAHVLALGLDAQQDAAFALEAAGFRLCATHAAEALASLDLLYVDLGNARDAELAALIDRATALQARFGAAMLVRFGRDQLDDAYAALDTGSATLLCDPTPLELAAALSRLRPAPVRGRVRENDDETERLQRLNDEVARIAETLAKLVQSEPPSPPLRDNRRAFEPGPAAAPALPNLPASKVRGAIRARRLRDQYFPSGLFADPAWDMLLDLFAAELEHLRVSVSSLCIAAAVPPTTALRWITSLTSHGLIEREPDLLDRRRAHIKLTARAGIAMRGYFNALERTGLMVL